MMDPSPSRRRNPLFNDNRLKLGIFGTNGRGGPQTLVPEAYRPTWDASVRTARLADEAGFEAIVAYARWKGYLPHAPHHPSGVVMDPFTWAAGIAQATSHAAIFATSHAPTVHPVAAAKQTATIDIISGGRFALNVVGGWNKPELEMFGAPLGEHDRRYDQLEEWLTIVRRLWTEPDELDFSGEFYTVHRAISLPQPVQRPCPPIMNAGGSGRGMRFACEHADICFVTLHSEEPEACAAQIARYKTMAREVFGREVQVWIYTAVVQRRTQAEAEAYLEYFAVQHEDTQSVDAWTAGLRDQTEQMPDAVLRAMRKRFAAGVGGNLLVGDAETIADKLEALSAAGLDGALFTWVDPIDGIARLTEDVLPILEARGLRAPFTR